MHWTLFALVELCVACAVLNIAQWRSTRTVRPIGLMICGVWIVQQTWWVFTGGNTLLMFLVCDVMLIAYLWRYASNWSDELILTLLLAGMCVYTLERMYGQSVQSWWIGWILVAIEMLLGLPRSFRQRIPGSVSHGRLHSAGDA